MISLIVLGRCFKLRADLDSALLRHPQFEVHHLIKVRILPRLQGLEAQLHLLKFMAAWYHGHRLVLPSWLLDYLLLPDFSRRRLDSEVKQQQQISNTTSTPRALLALEDPLLPQGMIFAVTFILASVR